MIAEKQKLIDGKVLYRCYTCRGYFPIESFYFNSKAFQNQQQQCKHCKRKSSKKTYHENHGREKQLNRYKNLTLEQRTALNKQQILSYWSNKKIKLWGRAKSRAKKTGLDFTITLDDFEIPDLCPLLEVPFKKGSRQDKWYSWSLDRIDNSKGYIPGNIQVVTYLANTMKSRASKEELITFANNILKLMT